MRNVTTPKFIAGGTGSDPIQCDGKCGLSLDTVVYVTAGGKAFGDCCAGAREEPIVDSISIYSIASKNPRLARFRIFAAAGQADAEAVVGIDEDPSTEQTNNKKPSRQRPEIVSGELREGHIYGHRKRADEKEKGNSKNSLLNGHL